MVAHSRVLLREFFIQNKSKRTDYRQLFIDKQYNELESERVNLKVKQRKVIK